MSMTTHRVFYLKSFFIIIRDLESTTLKRWKTALLMFDFLPESTDDVNVMKNSYVLISHDTLTLQKQSSLSRYKNISDCSYKHIVFLLYPPSVY